MLWNCPLQEVGKKERPEGRGGVGGVGWLSIQFLPPLKMFIIVEEIIPPFSPCAVIYAAILARLRGFGLTEGTGEGFRGGFFIRGRFGGGGRLGKGGKCGCAAVWRLETRLAGGAQPLGQEKGTGSSEEEPWLKHCTMYTVAGMFLLDC